MLVEHGEHGSSAAAPIARDIIRRYYEKKGTKDQKQYKVDYQRYDLGQPAATTATALPATGSGAAPAPAKPPVTAPVAPESAPQKPATTPPAPAATTADARRRGAQ